jgi:hypothetical protein
MNGLRRYTAEEHGLACVEDALLGGCKHIVMENLEALYFRGFKYSDENRYYYEPTTGVKITEKSLRYKGVYKEVDYMMENIKEKRYKRAILGETGGREENHGL